MPTAAEPLATLPEGAADFRLGLVGDTDPADGRLHLSLHLVGRDASLSAILPVLHSLGFEVLEEYPDRSVRPDGVVCRTYDFLVRLDLQAVEKPDVETLAGPVAAALHAVWSGAVDTDPFNGLVVRAGLTWREADLLRAYARYLRQLTFPFSQDYLCSVLAAHPAVARDLVGLFAARLDPDRLEPSARAGDEAEIEARLLAAVDRAEGIDTDRILRAYHGLVRATVRTNFFRDGCEVLALKLEPGDVEDVPRPRPRRETYVHSRRVEGVHLRFGAVARGGIRWSDRRQDYRTEILGLAKAQTTKNAVIVPLGAKGGFIVKNAPDRHEVVACYRLFVGALLDVVDDLDVTTGRVLPHPAVARRDGDDTYLVVAADKGTATFSDHANAVALERGYWLGDAFASGGSTGYDHKAMGITARGAWESVRQHLGELGHDVERDPTTVVGIGDMSGDVFGNGMLLSRSLRLVAAFDHRHVFLDPDPDPEASWAQRRRLVDLPRSSWAEYDASVISAGGGVWPRTAKAVPLSGPVRRVLGVTAERLAPHELIAAILRAPVDLLWNGGIGTYVKASTETHAAVGDRTNDPLRVDATELRARVVGEGGNLGLTQRARIEYARHGGRINTDALDNSAGVDCSDHEVNIKIVVDAAIRAGRLDRDARGELLSSMTDDVARLVLADNRDQNELLSLARATAARDLPAHARMLENLEEVGALDRTLDVLPTPAALRALAAANQGLTSPELATTTALAKLTLKKEILAGTLPDSPALTPRLLASFPTALQERCRDEIVGHPLRREIVATLLANDLVNTGGLTYLLRLQENNPDPTGDILRAHITASEVFDVAALRETVHATAMSTAARTEVNREITRLLDRATRWVLVHRPQPAAVGAEIARYREPIARLRRGVTGWLGGHDAGVVDVRTRRLRDLGVPEHLAERLGALVYEFSLLNVVDAAELGETDDLAVTAAIYFGVSARLRVGQILTELSVATPGDRWDAHARLLLRDDLRNAMCSLVGRVLTGTPDRLTPAERVAAWVGAAGPRVERVLTVLDQAEAEFGDAKATAVLSVLTRRIHALAGSPRPSPSAA